MTRAELLKMIEDEVTQTVSEPLKEPVVRPVYAPKPVLNTEEEIDEYLFRAGKKKEPPYKVGT